MATKDLAERLREAGEAAVKATTWEGASTDPFDRCIRAALAVQIPGPHIADRVCSSGDMEAISGTCYMTADQMKYVVAAVLSADRLSEVESGSGPYCCARCCGDGNFIDSQGERQICHVCNGTVKRTESVADGISGEIVAEHNEWHGVYIAGCPLCEEFAAGMRRQLEINKAAVESGSEGVTDEDVERLSRIYAEGQIDPITRSDVRAAFRSGAKLGLASAAKAEARVCRAARLAENAKNIKAMVDPSVLVWALNGGPCEYVGCEMRGPHDSHSIAGIGAATPSSERAEEGGK